MEKIKKCDLCGNENFSAYLESKDYFLTQEEFTIVKCENCGFLFVNPRPSSSEISRYYKSDNYISHSTKQKGLLNKVYVLIRKINHKKKYKIISKYKPTGSILDIGCATGEFLNYLKKNGREVCGIEPDETARTFAKKTYDLDVYNEEKLAELNENNFDIITMWHVLEHVHDINERINQIHRKLKNDGIAIIAVPNPASKDAAIYQNFWAGFDLPRHLYHFKFDTIKALFEKNGFYFLEKIPMKYDAYYISMISEKYKTGGKKLFKAFFNGYKSNLWAKKNNNEFSSMIYIFKKNGLK